MCGKATIKGFMVAGILMLSVGSAAASPKTLADWHDLDGRIAELEKRVRLAELERKLEEQKEVKLPSLPPPPGNLNLALPKLDLPVAPQVERPQVLSVAGVENQLEATLQWKDGSQLVVRTGDAMPGGRVMAVSANRVVVQFSGGKVETLSFASQPVPQETRSRR